MKHNYVCELQLWRIVEKMVHIPGWFDARQNKHNISEETAITTIKN